MWLLFSVPSCARSSFQMNKQVLRYICAESFTSSDTKKVSFVFFAAKIFSNLWKSMSVNLGYREKLALKFSQVLKSLEK